MIYCHYLLDKSRPSEQICLVKSSSHTHIHTRARAHIHTHKTHTHIRHAHARTHARTHTHTQCYLWNIWGDQEHSGIRGGLGGWDLNSIHAADHGTHSGPVPGLTKPPLTLSKPDVVPSLNHVINGVVSLWETRKCDWKKDQKNFRHKYWNSRWPISRLFGF